MTDERPTSESGELIAALTGPFGAKSVVLWTSLNPGDRVAFWWALDTLARGGVPAARCWVADSRYPEDGPDALEPCPAHTPEMVREAFARISPLTPARVRQGASLWAKYTDPSPVALDRVRRSRASDPVDGRVISELLFRALPRVIGNDLLHMRMSEFDQLLLGRLNDRELVRPYDVLVSAIHELHTRQTIHCFGDRVFTQRFLAWARHQPDDPILVSQPLSSSPNTLTNVAYRLTPKGRRVVDVGLEHPDEAPEFHTGGCHVYRGTPVWVRHVVGNDWLVKAWE